MSNHPHFFPEPFHEKWQKPLKDTNGVCRPLIFKDSVFEDNVIYVEYKKNRVPFSKFDFFLQKSNAKLVPDEIVAQVPLAKPIREQLEGLKTFPISCDQPELSTKDIVAHFSKYKNRFVHVNAYLSKENQTLLASHLLEKFKKPKISKKISWGWSDNPSWNLFGHITQEKQAKALNILKQAGATLQDNLFEVQEYNSVHKIVPGHCFAIKNDDTQISFVPKGSIGEKTIEDFEIKICVEKPSETQMKEAMNDYWKRRLFSINDLVRVRYIQKDLEGNRISDETRIEVWRWLNSKKRECFKNKEAFKRKDHNGVFVEVMLQIEEHHLADNKLWFAMDDEKWMRAKNYEVWQESWKAFENFQKSMMVVKYNSKTSKKPQNHHKEDEADEEIEILSDEQAAQQANWDLLSKSLHSFVSKNKLPRILKKFFLQGSEISSDAIFESCAKSRTIEIEQTAPRIEQGAFRIVGYDCPKKAVEELSRLNLVDGEALSFEAVDDSLKKLFETRSNPLGRIAFVHKDYQNAENQIKLPKGSMVIHGMTGVDTASQVSDRLEKICSMGGLLSIAERRRIGLSLLSMSPRGDIASGLDGAVPCKIGSSPHYGSLAFFGIHPKVLQRRDLFFAPLDYGAGKDRYPLFKEYAKSIGQEDVYTPPSHQARCKHIQTGLQHSHNEVYFRHQIGWDEIDSIWIHSTIWPALKLQWDKLIKQHEYLHNVCFEVFSDDISLKISQRADKLNL